MLSLVVVAGLVAQEYRLGSLLRDLFFRLLGENFVYGVVGVKVSLVFLANGDSRFGG